MMHRDPWRRGSRRTGYLNEGRRLVIEALHYVVLDGWNDRLTFEELCTANTVRTIGHSNEESWVQLKTVLSFGGQ